MAKEEEEPLSPMARIFQSSGADYCTVIIVGFKTKINPDVILDDLKQSVSKHPRISSKLVTLDMFCFAMVDAFPLFFFFSISHINSHRRTKARVL